MKVRIFVVSSLLTVGGLAATAAPAHAGLWCENVDEVDSWAETGGAGGTACRTALGVACAVVDKLNGGGGCLA